MIIDADITEVVHTQHFIRGNPISNDWAKLIELIRSLMDNGSDVEVKIATIDKNKLIERLKQ